MREVAEETHLQWKERLIVKPRMGKNAGTKSMQSRWLIARGIMPGGKGGGSEGGEDFREEAP